jgi:hypothetical protein
VLMAPAFHFAERWNQITGARKMEEWR